MKENKIIWTSIVEDLEYKIYSGVITEDMKFPSYSEIADQYKVDRSTALKVCKSLEVKNLIYLKSGLGFFLKPGARERVREMQILKIETKIELLYDDAIILKMTKDELINMLQTYWHDNSN